MPDFAAYGNTREIREIAGRVQSLSYTDMVAVAGGVSHHLKDRGTELKRLELAGILIEWADAVMKQSFENRPKLSTSRKGAHEKFEGGGYR